MSVVVLFLASLFGFILLTVPIAFALFLTALVLALAMGSWSPALVIQNIFRGIDSFPLMAIPFFLLAGEIMNTGGIAERIIMVAKAMCGHVRGGLGYVTVVASMLISGVSGSAVADTSAIGSFLYPVMKKEGYDPQKAAALVAASTTNGPIIPPSIPMVIFGVIANVSIIRLFVGGVIPGILACLLLIIPALFLSIRHNFGVDVSKAPKPKFWPALKDASWALAAPVLILGGLRTGWFTPTEAAVMAVVFGLFVGFVIYRSLTFRDVFELLIESAETSAVILIVVGLASVFAWATSTMGIVDPITEGLVALGGGHSLAVLCILLLFLKIAGMFLDGISIFLIFCPLFVPIAQRFGWDLVWFGVMMTYVIALGQFCPPMAVNLMVSCRLSGATMEETIRWDLWMLLFMGMGLVASAAALVGSSTQSRRRKTVNGRITLP